MELQPMYAAGNSQISQIAMSISPEAETIPVGHIEFFPPAPNYATIGTENDAEVVLYNGISDGMLTGCVRAQSGTVAKSWEVGTDIYHSFTADQANAITGNIAALVDHVADTAAELLEEIEGVSGDVSAVSQRLTAHNQSEEAHADIRSAVNAKATPADIAAHNTSGSAHSDIRSAIGSAVAGHNGSTEAHSDIRTALNTKAAAADLTAHNTNDAAHNDIRTALNTKAASADLTAHNTNGAAHSDIRTAVNGKIGTTELNNHNSNGSAHSDIRNLMNGKAPTAHASTGTGYGAGDGGNYGHVRLSDAVNSTSGVGGGCAATPYAVQQAYRKAVEIPRLLGNNNVGIGKNALSNNVSGSCNCAFGDNTLPNITSGDSNISICWGALHNLSTGHINCAIGSLALENTTTGSGNVALGSQAGRYAVSDQISNFDYTTCLGFGSSASGDSQVQLGNAWATVYAQRAVQTRSDRRDKKEISALKYDYKSFILGLKPSQFIGDPREAYLTIDRISEAEFKALAKKEQKNWRKAPPDPADLPADATADSLEEAVFYEKSYNKPSDGSKAGKRFHNGFIAQEVKELADSLNFDFAGYQDHSVNGGCDVLSIGYEEFIAPMVATIQDLSRELADLRAELAGLKAAQTTA